MTDILSQSEIDALLSALQSGDVDVEAIRNDDNTKKVRIYDFRRPSKFSKDQLYTLEVVFENFCRLLTTLLSGSLRSRVLAKVASVDQVTYEEFIRSIPNPSILNVFTFPPLEGKGILEINPIIGFSIIDRLFGGPGLSTVKGRPLTEIEKNVMERISEKILAQFKESWGSLVEADAFLENIEINPQFTQILSPLEMVIIITINTQIGDAEGFINICMPCLMLELISDKLNTKFWFNNSVRTKVENNSVYLQGVVEKTLLPLSASIGNSTVTIRELLELQIGDVINLEHDRYKDVDIYIDSGLKFNGKLGMSGNKLAIQITSMHQNGGL